MNPKRNKKLENDPTVGSLVYELNLHKNELVKAKDEIVTEAKDTLSEVKNTLSDKIKEADATLDEVVNSLEEAFAHIKTITKGEPGESPDEEAMEERLLAKIPKLEEIVNKIDVDEIAEKASSMVKPTPASLKIIKEEVQLDKEELVPMLNQAGNLKDLKLSLENISDIGNLRKDLNAEISRSKAYQQVSGGGLNNIQRNGTTVSTGQTFLNFTGSGVSSVTKSGQTTTVTISGGAGGGITSINADTTADQLLVTGTSGTDFTIVDDGTGTHTFNLPTASATNTGKLSATDWSTFNNKQNAITPAALTRTDDTNVTLTLGGTPGTALLQATSLTLGWTGSLAVGRGGTGGTVAGISLFNNITGYTASGATGTTSTNLVFSTSPTITTPTIATSLTASYATASTIAIFDGSKNLISADTATYPSLTELSYLKGVTSSIQTQLNAKGVGTVTSVGFTGGIISVATATTTPAFTVAGTSGGIPYFSSASTWATSAALAANAIVIGGGAGVAPATTTTGTGVLTALGVNVGSAGAFVTFNGALGTPSSGTVTNLTGTASININGTVGATTPTTGVFTTLVAGSTTSLLLGTAGSAVGNIGFRNATSGTITLAPATGALGTVTLTLPAATDTLVGKATTDTLTNKIVRNTVEPGTDDTYTGEDMTGFNATATIAQWDAVYLSTTGWALTDADATATAGGVCVGLAATSGTNGNPLTVVTRGVIRNDGWTWATVGAPLYLSTTTGALTETAPSGTDDVIRVVGYVMSDECIFFCPSTNWIVHT